MWARHGSPRSELSPRPYHVVAYARKHIDVPIIRLRQVSRYIYLSSQHQTISRRHVSRPQHPPRASDPPPSSSPATATSTVPFIRTQPASTISRRRVQDPLICSIPRSRPRLHSRCPHSWCERLRLSRHKHKPLQQRRIRSHHLLPGHAATCSRQPCAISGREHGCWTKSQSTCHGATARKRRSWCRTALAGCSGTHVSCGEHSSISA